MEIMILLKKNVIKESFLILFLIFLIVLIILLIFFQFGFYCCIKTKNLDTNGHLNTFSHLSACKIEINRFLSKNRTNSPTIMESN